MSELGEACEMWQSGRDDGSSRLRAAARILTRVPHYFAADFITAQESAARQDQQAMAYAGVLLRNVRASAALTAAQWRQACWLATGCYAGRGLKCKPQDDQIEAVLDSGVITMPLWGVSLDERVAAGFGTRFLFRLDGPFHGVAAWLHSGVEEGQREIITGGRYRITALERNGTTTTATLQEVGQIAPPDHSASGPRAS
jgi:hypothetical protein